MRFSLRTKILLLIAGTIAGFASLLLITLALLTGREIGNAVRHDVQSTGGVLGQLVQERGTALKEQSLLLARQPVLIACIGTSDPATVTDCVTDYLNQLHADAAMVTDQSGRVLGEVEATAREEGRGKREEKAGDNKAPALRQSDEPGIAAALQGQTSAGVELRYGRLMLAVSVPVLEPVSKYVKGTFTAYSAIDAQVAQGLKNALGSEIAFVAHGQVVGASLPLPSHLPTPQGMARQVTLGHARYFALYAPLPNTATSAGLGFVVLRPYNLAMAMYYRFHAAFTFLFLLALPLALVAGAAVARGITHPLDGVVQAAHVLSAGGWPARFQVRRRDEVGLLQSVFNEMTTALQAHEARLLALIDTDPLTELDNHRRFQERLAQEAKRCMASGEPLSLLLFDLDHFQQYNQQHGHAAGDEALQKVASFLRDVLPEVAILARYGGEEFVALLPQHRIEQASDFAEQIRCLAHQTWSLDGGARALSLSVGCAEFGKHTTQAEGLLMAAELAVSRAKELGRDRVCHFDSVPGADETSDPYQLYKFFKDRSLSTIQALAAAVDAKDPYTQGHSQRVAQYASELAHYVGMLDADIDLVYTTGTLHDVGKIGVPDAILKKPAPLDAEERTTMQTHPVLGEVIVRKAPQLAATLPGVRHHHERWDGRGYPDNLSGEEIPRIARLLAVADTFDAMTSERPYRKGMALEIALTEIAKGAGTQFDPELAAAFVAMMRVRYSQLCAA
jgi:diguanylate cyclase (GGDEF)-like protein